MLLLAMASFLAAGACLAGRLSPALMRRGFWLFALLFLVGNAVFGFVGYRAFLRWCTEDHVVEWLTADCLLVAWVLGLAVTIRLARRGAHSPMAAFLTAGYFWGFWRELEWGKPFFGTKLIYTRFFFRIRPYLSVSHFDQLSSEKGVSSLTMFMMHWAAALLCVVLVGMLVIYIIRHKEAFWQESKRLGKTTYGRYFLLGVAIGLGSNGVGAIAHQLANGELLAGSGLAGKLPHFVLEEPLELLATVCLAMSIIALWQATDGGRALLLVGLASEGDNQP